MPRMVMVNDVLPEEVEHLLDVLGATGLCSNVRHTTVRSIDLETKDPVERVQMQFKVQGQSLNTIIKALRYNGYDTFDILNVAASTELVPAITVDRMSWARWLFPSIGDRVSTLEIHGNIVSGSQFNFDHGVFICIAVSLSALGLLTDSSVSILAAFFVSPLMNMILACTWGLVIRDWLLVRRGLINTLKGAVLAFAGGALTGLVLICMDDDPHSLLSPKNADQVGPYAGMSLNTGEILSRGPPTRTTLWATAVVATISGLTIGLGQSLALPNALTGVTLAASLLPPLVNSGMLFVIGCRYGQLRLTNGYRLHEVAFVSFLMYCITVPLVMLWAYMIFKFKHVGGKRSLSHLFGEQDVELRERLETLGVVSSASWAVSSAESGRSRTRSRQLLRSPTTECNQRSPISSSDQRSPTTELASIDRRRHESLTDDNFSLDMAAADTTTPWERMAS